MIAKVVCILITYLIAVGAGVTRWSNAVGSTVVTAKIVCNFVQCPDAVGACDIDPVLQ